MKNFQNLFFCLALFFVGCTKEMDLQETPTIPQEAAIDLVVTNAPARNQSNSPYLGTTKFRSALDLCKLQGNNSRTLATPAALKRGYYNTNFFLKNGKYMRFGANGAKGRTELRCLEEWDAANRAAKSLTAKVKLFSPPSGVEEVTIAQIHAKSSDSGKPFLRIAYYKNRKGYSKYIWAVIRDKDNNGKYQKIPLAKLTNTHSSLSIKVQNRRLYVSYNGKNMPSHTIHSSWYDTNMYFKAGCYVQTNGGKCKVEYKELDFRLP